MTLIQHHILLVDGDQEASEALASFFQEQGYAVQAVRTAEDAIGAINAGPVPDVIITAVELPGEAGGFELCGHLRSVSVTRGIALILVSDRLLADETEEAQNTIRHSLRLLDIAIEDYLPHSVDRTALAERVRNHIRDAGHDRLLEALLAGVTNVGRLEYMDVIDLTRFFESSNLSGKVFISLPSGRAQLFYREGQLIDARAGRDSEEKAFFRLLSVSEGTFEIALGEPGRPARISTTTQDLLAEGMKRQAEMRWMRMQLPPLNTILSFNFELLSERLGDIPDEENSLLRLFDGQNSISDILAKTEFSELEALKIISGLFFDGLFIIEGTAKPRESEAAADADEQPPEIETWPDEPSETTPLPPPPEQDANADFIAAALSAAAKETEEDEQTRLDRHSRTSLRPTLAANLPTLASNEETPPPPAPLEEQMQKEAKLHNALLAEIIYFPPPDAAPDAETVSDGGADSMRVLRPGEFQHGEHVLVGGGAANPHTIWVYQGICEEDDDIPPDAEDQSAEGEEDEDASSLIPEGWSLRGEAEKAAQESESSAAEQEIPADESEAPGDEGASSDELSEKPASEEPSSGEAPEAEEGPPAEVAAQQPESPSEADEADGGSDGGGETEADDEDDGFFNAPSSTASASLSAVGPRSSVFDPFAPAAKPEVPVSPAEPGEAASEPVSDAQAEPSPESSSDGAAEATEASAAASDDDDDDEQAFFASGKPRPAAATDERRAPAAAAPSAVSGSDPVWAQQPASVVVNLDKAIPSQAPAPAAPQPVPDTSKEAASEEGPSSETLTDEEMMAQITPSRTKPVLAIIAIAALGIGGFVYSQMSGSPSAPSQNTNGSVQTQVQTSAPQPPAVPTAPAETPAAPAKTSEAAVHEEPPPAQTAEGTGKARNETPDAAAKPAAEAPNTETPTAPTETDAPKTDENPAPAAADAPETAAQNSASDAPAPEPTPAQENNGSTDSPAQAPASDTPKTTAEAAASSPSAASDETPAAPSAPPAAEQGDGQQSAQTAAAEQPAAPAPDKSKTAAKTASSGNAALNWDALMDKGEALIDKERYRQARALYEDALKKRPKDQRALSGMGRVLIVSERRGEAERGRRMLEEALRLDDTDALAWRDLGIYFQFAEPPKVKEAIRAYENFLRYAPSHRDAKETRSIVRDLKSKL